MERARWSYCHFPRLDIAYIWGSTIWYHEGYKSEITERASIRESGAIVVFLLLIEEKCSGCEMDS